MSPDPSSRLRKATRTAALSLAILVAATLLLVQPAAAASPGPSASPTPPAPSSSKDLYDPGAVMVSPPAPSGTTSFAYTANGTISKTKTQSIYSNCPDGWYVRPAQPSAWTPTDVNAALSLYTGSDVTATNQNSVSAFYTTTGDGHVFQNLGAQFYNWSLIHNHPAAMTFWCDALPSWYADPSSSSLGDAKSVGVSPIDPSCFYCLLTAQFTNLSSGLALDPGGSAGSPVLVQASTGSSSQNWYLQGNSAGSVFYDGIATFGFWQDATLLSTAISDPGGGSYVFASASSEPPQGGQFSFVDWGAGSVYGAVMLIESDTTWSGSTPEGGMCLTDPETAGQQVTAQPCDATNEAQWWVEHPES